MNELNKNCLNMLKLFLRKWGRVDSTGGSCTGLQVEDHLPRKKMEKLKRQLTRSSPSRLNSSYVHLFLSSKE